MSSKTQAQKAHIPKSPKKAQDQQIQDQVQQQRVQNTQLSLRNQILHREIIDLKQGVEAIEERARYELGLIKPNETFYRIVQSSQ